VGADDAPGWPGWRSLLFVPAHDRPLVQKAAARGADALILDLEDAVAESARASARAALPEVIARLHADGAQVLVRVNSGALDLLRDLEACVRPGLAAVVLPKCEQPQRLRLLDELLSELEAAGALVRGTIGVIGLVETARGLLAAPQLALASMRLLGLALGPEDLALDLGGEPEAELLTEPARRIAWAARAAGRVAIGFPGSIANYTDMERLRADLASARRIGFSAALCIHPRQLEPCHEAFSVTPAEAEHAQRVVEAYAAAERRGLAVCSLEGRMIDRPVVLRAQAVTARWRLQNPREE
jgi:citrate lyase subunit beta / citryl-CoA lyase